MLVSLICVFTFIIFFLFIRLFHCFYTRWLEPLPFPSRILAFSRFHHRNLWLDIQRMRRMKQMDKKRLLKREKSRMYLFLPICSIFLILRIDTRSCDDYALVGLGEQVVTQVVINIYDGWLHMHLMFDVCFGVFAIYCFISLSSYTLTCLFTHFCLSWPVSFSFHPFLHLAYQTPFVVLPSYILRFLSCPGKQLATQRVCVLHNRSVWRCVSWVVCFCL